MTENQATGTTTTCASCGASVESDLRFCGECGTQRSDAPVQGIPLPLPRQREVPHLDHVPANATVGLHELLQPMPASRVSSPTQPLAEPNRTRHRLRLISLVVVIATVMAGVGVLALNDRGTHARLATSQQQYRASQARLGDTLGTLKSTRVDLASTTTSLQTTKASLQTTTTELNSTKKALTTKVQQLAGVRNNLSDVKHNVTIQATQIETLKSCLNGVSIALGDLANGDYSGALAALQAVDVSCNAAYKLF